MKKLITFLFASSLFLFAHSQSFYVLEEDPSGDPSQSVNDVERISVAIDPQMDSLWLRLDFHQPLSGDVGFVFGIDTDLNPMTGTHAWNGVQSGLMCEEIIIINRNSIDPTFFYGSSSIGNLGQQAIALNDTSILVRLKLSLIDADGIFNLIGGSGFFDAALTNRQIYDEIPTAGWLMVSPQVSIDPGAESIGLKVFPQPARSLVYLKLDNHVTSSQTGMLLIVDLHGKILISKEIEPFMEIDVSKLPTGTYVAMLQLQDRYINRLITVKH